MRSLPPRWLLFRRAARQKAARVLKLMLCAMLVFGLFPGSDELVETVVHLVHDGHLPHSEQHDLQSTTEDCGDSDEHGCTPLAHHCQCCFSVSAIPLRLPELDAQIFHPAREKYRSHHARGPPNPGVKPFLRPPIT